MIYNFTVEEQVALDSQLKEFAGRWEKNKRIIQTREGIDDFVDEFTTILSAHSGEPIESKPKPVEYTIAGDAIYDPVELDEYESSPEYQEYLFSVDEAWAKAISYRNKWESQGSLEWQNANRENRHLYIDYEKARTELIQRMEANRFAQLKTATEVRNDAREQVNLFFLNTYQEDVGAVLRGELKLSAYEHIRSDGDSFWLDKDFAESNAKNILDRHYDFFIEHKQNTELLDKVISDAIEQSSFISNEGELLKIEDYLSQRAFSFEASLNKDYLISKDNNNLFRRRYTTKAQVSMNNNVSSVPKSLALPSLANFVYSLTFNSDGEMHLKKDKVSNLADGLMLKGNTLSFDKLTDNGIVLSRGSVTEGKINLTLLQILYSTILADFQQDGEDAMTSETTLYLPDLYASMGRQSNLNQKDADEVMEQIKALQTVIGINEKTKEEFSVFTLVGHNPIQKTITFKSDYLTKLALMISDRSLERDKKGNLIFDKNGKTKTRPNHSYLVHASINTERNKAAVENVKILVTLIERAGTRDPHIAAKTLMDHNPIFKQQFESSPNKQQVLDRVFPKTWELLRTQTDLLATYQGIELPDPTDKNSVPRVKELATKVYTFPNKGKSH